MKKRILALGIAVCVITTSIVTDTTVFANEVDEQMIEESKQLVDDGESTEAVDIEDEYTIEETTEENVEEQEESTELVTEQEDVQSTENIESTEDVEEVEDTEIEENETGINYVMVESEYIEIPGEQNVVVSLGTDSSEWSELELVYQNMTTGEYYSVGSMNQIDDLVLFTMQFQEESQIGKYQILAINGLCKGQYVQIDLLDLEIDIYFGVEQEVEVSPDEYVCEEETVNADIVTMDEDGEVTSENTIEDVLDNEEGIQSAADELKTYTGNGNLVVVLDPGHDDTHTGASGNGTNEQSLVLKIAQYCRDELNTYSGVTVYMTRESGTCPYGGASITAGTCNEKRVSYAQSVGANVYVSFHLNSSTSSSADGVGVYYPNSNYNAQIGETGKGLASSIYNKLRSLGLSQWSDGIIVRNSENNTTYPDGSLADYLGVIRNCKNAGIPAVLIEHAFLSNSADYSNYLSTDDKLKTLGVADATAIAEYYGLTKTSTIPVITYVISNKDGEIELKWSEIDGITQYEVYRSTSKSGTYSKVATVSNNTNYTDSSVQVSTKYYYKIRTINSDGTVGQTSEAVKGMVLAEPEITSVTSKASKQLQIDWNVVRGADGYYIYRRNTSTGKYEQIATVSADSGTSYVDSVESNNKYYKYKVRAYQTSNGTIGVGPVSEGMSGKAVAKTQITNLEEINENQIEITWSSVSGASGYRIKRSTEKNGTYEKIATLKSESVVSYNDTDLKSGTVYYYKVEVINTVNGTNGYSGYSDAKSIRTVAKPKVSSVSSENETALNIIWTKSTGASGYKIKRSSDKGETYQVIATIKSGDTTSYQDTGLVVGKKYYYRIEAINGSNGYSGYSSAGKGRTVAKTTINYVVSSGSNAIELAWEEVSGASGYKIKRSTEKNGSYKVIKEITSGETTTYKDSKLTAGKTYYYRVESINEVNGVQGYSGYSPIVSEKLLKQTAFTDVKDINSTSILLNWGEVSGADGYQIYRSNSENGAYVKIATVKGKSQVSYQDTGLGSGTTYYYKVRAYQSNNSKIGKATYSAILKAWTLDRVTVASTAVNDGTKVTITWNKVKNASGYSINRSEKSGSGYTKIGKVSSGNTLSYTDTSAEAGTKYYYKICANSTIKGSTLGRGNYSKELKVTLLSQNKISSVALQGDGSINISWTSVANAQGYQLSYSTQKNTGYTALKKTSALSYTHTDIESGVTYYYRVRSYTLLADGTKVYSSWSDIKSKTAGYTIMGASSLTVEEMLAYYNARYTYPSSVYSSKGASTAEVFFTILKEEAEAEGVKTEVLFAQVMLETGGLQFGGSVQAEQCNFGGLGSTADGVAGETYKNVRTGLRAQVQHLKAYGSTETLVNKCVDTRFSYVTRGSAKYVEWLSIPNNPNGKGWASDPDYATKLLSIISKL